MVKGNGDDDVTKKTLTPQQRAFMEALQEAISEANQPVSVGQIKIQLQKSDSRVRSHIKVLIRKGYVRCVGKARVKKYVPSMLWLEEIDVNPEYGDVQEVDLPCLGGYCMTPGCTKMAEDWWRDGYYCRDCIVGRDEKSDEKDLRKQFESMIAPRSPAGMMVDMVNPTYNEDALPPGKSNGVLKYRNRSKKRKTSRRRQVILDLDDDGSEPGIRGMNSRSFLT